MAKHIYLIDTCSEPNIKLILFIMDNTLRLSKFRSNVNLLRVENIDTDGM